MAQLQYKICLKALGQGVQLLNHLQRKSLSTTSLKTLSSSYSRYSPRQISRSSSTSENHANENDVNSNHDKSKVRRDTQKLHKRILTIEEKKEIMDFEKKTTSTSDDYFGADISCKVLHNRPVRELEDLVEETLSSTPANDQFGKLLSTSKTKQNKNSKVRSDQMYPKFPNSTNSDPNRTNSDVVHVHTKINHIELKPNLLTHKKDERNWKNTFGTLIDENPNIDINENLSDSNDLGEDKTHIRLSKYNRRNVPYWYGKQIEKFGKRGMIKEAIAVLEDWMLKRDRVKPHKYNFSVLIGVLGRVGYTKKAFQVFNQMKKMGLEADAVTYTGLFNACANSPWKEDGLQRAKHLHEIMREKNWHPNMITGRAMIKTYGICGDLPAAFAVMDELSKRFELDQRCFGSLLGACISDKKKGMRLALEVWQLMLRYKVKPDLLMYNLLLQAVRECGMTDSDSIPGQLDGGAYQLEHNVSKTVDSCIPPQSLFSNQVETDEKLMLNNAVVIKSEPSAQPNLLAASTDLQTQMNNLLSKVDFTSRENRLALLGGRDAFLEHVKYTGEKPDIRTFSLLLDNSPQNAQAEEELMEIMEKYGVQPDLEFYNSLMRKRCLRNDFSEAKTVLLKMATQNLSLNMQSFEILSISCKAHKEGLQLLRNIEEAGSQPSREVLTSLIKASGMNFYYKLDIIRLLDQLNLQPDEEILKCIEKDILKGKYLIVKQESGGNKESNISLLQEGFKKFMIFYTAWLKRSEISKPEHPWSVYRQSKAE